MRFRAALFRSTLAWLAAGVGLAYAKAEATVDPFLQAAQWAEGASAVDATNDGPSLPDSAAVGCGDEIGMAGVVAAGSQQQGRWTALTELPLLTPDFSWVSLETVGDEPLVGPRLSLGWESSSGIGIRGRGWGFDNSVDVQGPLASSGYLYAFATPTSHEVTLKGGRLDLDLYRRIESRKGFFAFGASLTAAELKLRERYVATQSHSYYVPEFYDMDFGLGMEVPGFVDHDEVTDDLSHGLSPGPVVRYDFDDYYDLPIIGIAAPYGPELRNLESVATTYHDGVSTTTYQGGGVLRNRGYGLGLLSEGEHRFYETSADSWALFARGRLAWLLGQWEEPAGSAEHDGDGTMTIAEGALGIAYRRSLRQADLIVQCSIEAQSWDVAIADQINLLGVTTGVGVGW